MNTEEYTKMMNELASNLCLLTENGTIVWENVVQNDSNIFKAEFDGDTFEVSPYLLKINGVLAQALPPLYNGLADIYTKRTLAKLNSYMSNKILGT